uniref:Uncharacterized protein n=1 Tax=Arundo donax TaxID=35708 RepID=A0A0A8Y9Y6_ARUDO
MSCTKDLHCYQGNKEAAQDI